MNIYFQKNFLPVFALFFSVFTLALIQLKIPIHIAINSKFIIVVNSILFIVAFFSRKTLAVKFWIPTVLFILHFSYGLGFILGLNKKTNL